ncbi:hypothetical protein D3C81_1504540 [compost metagenome]
MVLRAAFPAVVGDFVVVPQRHHRCHLVQFLQVCVGAITGQAHAVVEQRHHLVIVCRQDIALGNPILRFVGPDAVLIDVVADVQPQIHVVAFGGVCVGVEPTDGQVGAGEQAEFEAGHLADRQGTRAANR